MEKILTTEKVKAIAEELRTTRYKSTGKMAFKFVYDKYRELFADHGGFDGFLYIMNVCATFFCSQGQETERIRQNTKYIYV